MSNLPSLKIYKLDNGFLVKIKGPEDSDQLFVFEDEEGLNLEHDLGSAHRTLWRVCNWLTEGRQTDFSKHNLVVRLEPGDEYEGEEI